MGDDLLERIWYINTIYYYIPSISMKVTCMMFLICIYNCVLRCNWFLAAFWLPNLEFLEMTQHLILCQMLLREVSKQPMHWSLNFSFSYIIYLVLY